MQSDLFPERVDVERLDERAVAGSRTRVRAVYRVRFELERAAHQVFNDRYGWYCSEHGEECRAVTEVRLRLEPGAR